MGSAKKGVVRDGSLSSGGKYYTPVYIELSCLAAAVDAAAAATARNAPL